MEPISDKMLSGFRFWPEVKRRLRKAKIPSQLYYKVLGRDIPAVNYKTYPTPRISQMPAVFDLLKMYPSEIFDSIGRSDYLLPDTQKVLDLFNQLDSKTIKGLTEAAYTTVGSWMYDSIPYNPACRLFLFIEHHIIPTEQEDYYVYAMKLKYKRLPKAEVKAEELPEWMIGNYRRLPASTINFDIEEWMNTANFLKCSFRWLYGYERTASFYGYKPEAETLYDVWTLATPAVQKMLVNVANFKLQEV